eukprot:687450-Amphidinium_carterae.1
MSTILFGHTASGLLTGMGLEFLAGKLSGPSVDSTTLQLVGMLFASTLFPGLERAIGVTATETTKVTSRNQLQH